MTDAPRLLIEALYLALWASLPLLGLAFMTGAATAALQSATRLTEPAINNILRLVAVLLALSIAGPWMGSQIVRFASTLYESLPERTR